MTSPSFPEFISSFVENHKQAIRAQVAERQSRPPRGGIFLHKPLRPQDVDVLNAFLAYARAHRQVVQSVETEGGITAVRDTHFPHTQEVA